MIRKNGFTLVELLAVIIILAIIAIIAVPLILGVIKKAKIGSAEDSTLGYLDSFEKQMMINLVQGKPEFIDGTYTIGGEFLTANSIFYKGEGPSKGIVVVEGSKIVNAELCVMGYPIDYRNNKAKYNKNAIYCDEPTEEVPDSYINGTAVYFNPETGNICNEEDAVSTTGTKTGCMKWYIFNDTNESSTVNMILDHNTTAVVAWNSTGYNNHGPTNVLTQLASDTSSWTGILTRNDTFSFTTEYVTEDLGTGYTIDYSSYKARLITAAEIATITGNSSFVEGITEYEDWFYFDSNNQTQTANTTVASNYAWLFDYLNYCMDYGCNNTTTDLTLGYWTSTAESRFTGDAWTTRYGGLLENINVDYADDLGWTGIRPVITIPKSIIS